MATLTFSFDTGSVLTTRITDAFASVYGYQAVINGSPNPETKPQFARRMVMQYIISTVQTAEVKAATAAASAAVTPITLI